MQDIYAKYARTSHIEDIEFFLKHCNAQIMDRAMRRAWLALRAKAPRLSKRKVQALYRTLLGSYWQRVSAFERAMRADDCGAPLRYVGTYIEVPTTAKAKAGQLPFTHVYKLVWLDTWTGEVVERKAA
jgi:hypothetical protein